jgi:hypothetical protein
MGAAALATQRMANSSGMKDLCGNRMEIKTLEASLAGEGESRKWALGFRLQALGFRLSATIHR